MVVAVCAKNRSNIVLIVVVLVGIGCCETVDVGRSINLILGHDTKILKIYGIKTCVVAGVLCIYKTNLVCAVLLCNECIAGFPACTNTGDSVDILIVYNNVKLICAKLGGGVVVKCKSVTNLEVNVEDHLRIGAFLKCVRGLDNVILNVASLNLYCIGNEGPRVFLLLIGCIVGIGTILNVKVAAVKYVRDLIACGHLYVRLFLGNDLVVIVNDLLLIVFLSEEIKDYVKYSLAGNCTCVKKSNNAISVNDCRGGITLNVECGEETDLVHTYVKGKTIGALEVSNVNKSVLVNRGRVKCDDCEIILILLVSRLHKGELGNAPRTLGIPEVDKYCLLLLKNLGESEGCTLGSGNCEVLHYRACVVCYANKACIGKNGRGYGDGHIVRYDGIVGLCVISLRK